MAEALLGEVCAVSEHGRNAVWRWFSEPAQRAAYPLEEHEHYSRLHENGHARSPSTEGSRGLTESQPVGADGVTAGAW